jgi:poly-gamma-glutamate synthesis protein (capsule biosynthesis protein)
VIVSEKLILSAVGDVMLGDLPACTGFGVGSMISRHGPLFPFQKCRDALVGSDIIFGNLEVVLSRFHRDSDPFESCHLRAQPEAVDGLVWAGFNVMNLANNHLMQHGREAVIETIELLTKNNIAVTGLADTAYGITNLAVVNAKGKRIAFLGYNFRPEQYRRGPRLDVVGSRRSILEDIETVRRTVDIVVISLHWGEEFIDRPSAEQIKLGRELVDSGAHIVLGHHPHILQGVEKHGHGVIAYSLGNFVFDFWQKRLRRSMILRLNLEDPGAISFEIVPLTINKQWQPTLLAGAEIEKSRREIAELQLLIDENADELLWQKEVARELKAFRRSVYWHYLRSLHRYGARRFIANLGGIAKRRLASSGK